MSNISYAKVGQRHIDTTPLLECLHVDVNPSVRVWYLPWEERSGFRFMVGRWHSAAYADATMDDSDTEVECLFHGVAMFDGIRHLCMGDETADDEGYVNYPDVREVALVFVTLHLLERELCWYVASVRDTNRSTPER